jgi:hypothetical protein
MNGMNMNEQKEKAARSIQPHDSRMGSNSPITVKQPITSNIRKPCRGQPSHATQAGQLLYEEEDLQQGRHPCDSFTSVLAAKVPKGARNPSRAHRKPSNTK